MGNKNVNLCDNQQILFVEKLVGYMKNFVKGYFCAPKVGFKFYMTGYFVFCFLS